MFKCMELIYFKMCSSLLIIYDTSQHPVSGSQDFCENNDVVGLTDPLQSLFSRFLLRCGREAVQVDIQDCLSVC